jgi:hypothetical protein
MRSEERADNEMHSVADIRLAAEWRSTNIGSEWENYHSSVKSTRKVLRCRRQVKSRREFPVYTRVMVVASHDLHFMSVQGVSNRLK